MRPRIPKKSQPIDSQIANLIKPQDLAIIFIIANPWSPGFQRECPPSAACFNRSWYDYTTNQQRVNHSHESSSNLLVSPENNGATMSKWLTPPDLDAQSKNSSRFRVQHYEWWKMLSIMLLDYWLSNDVRLPNRENSGKAFPTENIKTCQTDWRNPWTSSVRHSRKSQKETNRT